MAHPQVDTTPPCRRAAEALAAILTGTLAGWLLAALCLAAGLR